MAWFIFSIKGNKTYDSMNDLILHIKSHKVRITAVGQRGAD